MLEKFEKIREFSPEFFAGANSAEGFFSCFDSLYDPEKDSFYILKGGPGTGKSTLMKRLSEKLYGKGEVPELEGAFGNCRRNGAPCYGSDLSRSM